MPIVASFITAHAPGITGYPEAADEKKRNAVFAAFETLRQRVVALQPDLIVGISDDHFSIFFEPMPAFCFGLGAQFRGPNPDFEAIMGLPCRQYRGHPEYAKALLDQAFNTGFEPAFARGELLFEDQFPIPLNFLDPQRTLPIVPIYVNCLVKPMATLRRCYELGRVIADVARTRPERILVLATGGLSHWVGTPEEGQINGPFEESVISAMRRGCTEELLTLSDEEIGAAGNGAHELRNWLVAAGASPGMPLEVLAHVPVPEWQSGIVVGALGVAAG